MVSFQTPPCDNYGVSTAKSTSRSCLDSKVLIHIGQAVPASIRPTNPVTPRVFRQRTKSSFITILINMHPGNIFLDTDFAPFFSLQRPPVLRTRGTLKIWSSRCRFSIVLSMFAFTYSHTLSRYELHTSVLLP